MSDSQFTDTNTRPQDDLYRHVNGHWLQTHEIPADRARDGAFREVHDRAEEHVRTLITEAEQVEADDPSAADAARIADLYASFMDTDRIDSLGVVAPLAPDLDLVTAAQNRGSLTRAMAALQRTGVTSAVELMVYNDFAHPDQYKAFLCQGGLGLPDEAYYRQPEYRQIRTDYVGHIAAMLALAGIVTEDEAHGVGEQIMRLETDLAKAHWDKVRDRDMQATYNPMSLAEVAESAPGFDWQMWVSALDLPEGTLDQVIVREPSYLQAFSELWTSHDVSTWRSWLTWHVIHARAPYLGAEIVEENFDFYGRVLTGAQQNRERWKRGVSLVQAALGEAVGKLYVQRHFPPSHKEAMGLLVADLIEAYRVSINDLEWMSPATRDRALEKLEKFTTKIGYPSKWQDYSGLEFIRDDLLGNVRLANSFALTEEFDKILHPEDRDDWVMPPQTVNAWFDPAKNEIVFPAGILAPPFFDADADAAQTYGAIGAVIGHEIGHGFDDQGSRFDGDGRMVNWWTDEDRAEFDIRAQALIAQYNELSPAQLTEPTTVNGELTIGENIGDLGGLGIAIKAYRIAMARIGQEVTDTDLQRLFMANAGVWRMKSHDEETLRLLTLDPHSPPEFRCNQVARNLDEFHTAFGTEPADQMWLDPKERVQIW